MKRRTGRLDLVVFLMLLFMMLGVCPQKVWAYPVKLSSTTATVDAGKTKILYLRGTTQKVTWKSSNTSVVSVSDNGKISSMTSKATIKGKKKGTAVITASVSGKKYKCKVTVKALPVSISNSYLCLEKGSSKALTLKNAVGKVNWSSSNPSVASVSSKGMVKAKKSGKAAITAKNAGKKYSCNVQVVNTSSDNTDTVTAAGTENLNKLKAYLQSKGSKDKSGDRYIQLKSNGNIYKITYVSSNRKFLFYAYIQKGSKYISMNVSIPNSSAGVVARGVMFNPYGVSAYIKSASYKKTSIPVFSLANSYEQAAAVEGLKASFSGWNSLLKRKTGLKMSDIGFLSYQ